MKTIELFFRCAGEKIKNKFFNSENAGNGAACGQWQKYTEAMASKEEQPGTEEYLINFQYTTRWQTL